MLKLTDFIISFLNIERIVNNIRSSSFDIFDSNFEYKEKNNNKSLILFKLNYVDISNDILIEDYLKTNFF